MKSVGPVALDEAAYHVGACDRAQVLISWPRSKREGKKGPASHKSKPSVIQTLPTWIFLQAIHTTEGWEPSL